MQLKSSTDYAIRIVCYLATHNGMVSTSELSKQLYIALTYIEYNGWASPSNTVK